MEWLTRIGLCAFLGAAGLTLHASPAMAKFCREGDKNLAPNTMRCRSDNRYYRCQKDGTWKDVGKCKYRAPKAAKGPAKRCPEGDKNLAPNTMRCRPDNRYYRCQRDGTWKDVGKCKYKGK
jgi:hypothetical protein